MCSALIFGSLEQASREPCNHRVYLYDEQYDHDFDRWSKSYKHELGRSLKDWEQSLHTIRCLNLADSMKLASLEDGSITTRHEACGFRESLVQHIHTKMGGIVSTLRTSFATMSDNREPKVKAYLPDLKNL